MLQEEEWCVGKDLEDAAIDAKTRYPQYDASSYVLEQVKKFYQ